MFGLFIVLDFFGNNAASASAYALFIASLTGPPTFFTLIILTPLPRRFPFSIRSYILLDY